MGFRTFITLSVVTVLIGLGVSKIAGHIAQENSLKDAKAVSTKLIVKVGTANVHQEPGTFSTVLKKVDEGATLQGAEATSLYGSLWYKISNKDNQKEWISSKEVNTNKVLINTPVISQLPQLDRGCEVTSLSMLLEQAGIKVSKMTLANQINTLPFKDGRYNSNPNDGFVGDIYSFSQPGYGVYHSPIAKLAKKYLGNGVDDMTGESWSEVEQKLDEGHAVWVIINSTFKLIPSNNPFWTNLKTKEGTIRVNYLEHSVLVTGYDADRVYVNNPLSGQKNEELDKTNFISSWKQMGSQAISY